MSVRDIQDRIDMLRMFILQICASYSRRGGKSLRTPGLHSLAAAEVANSVTRFDAGGRGKL